MNFVKKFYFFSFLLVTQLSCTLDPNMLGAGMFLYRFNPQHELEFLFTLDPYQTHQDRMGFEHPGGSIGDHQLDLSIQLDSPVSCLKGAIREMLEELYFLPAILMQQHALLKPSYKGPYQFTVSKDKKRVTLMIIPTYQQAAVEIIAQQLIEEQGICYLHKAKIFNERSKLADQNTIFFWNITDICPENLPKAIIQYRMFLKKQTPKLFFVTDIHAEPIAFAWVKAKDLIPLLSGKTGSWVPVSQYAEYDMVKKKIIFIKESKLQTGTLGKHATKVVHNNKILISPACMGMIQDRINDKFNPQENNACKLCGMHPDQTSSSMKATIKMLTY